MPKPVTAAQVPVTAAQVPVTAAPAAQVPDNTQESFTFVPEVPADAMPAASSLPQPVKKIGVKKILRN